MKENIQQILMNAIFEVFEKMFFVFLEPTETINSPYDHISRIDFDGKGKVAGGLSIMFSQGMAEMMAQNMLGCEKNEITDQVLIDCTKEAANMVCGNFLRKMDQDNVFTLGLPQYAAKGQEEQKGILPPTDADNIILSFEAEEKTLQLIFYGKKHD
jgi:CheY-specific phosphatase CheX